MAKAMAQVGAKALRRQHGKDGARHAADQADGRHRHPMPPVRMTKRDVLPGDALVDDALDEPRLARSMVTEYHHHGAGGSLHSRQKVSASTPSLLPIISTTCRRLAHQSPGQRTVDPSSRPALASKPSAPCAGSHRSSLPAPAAG